MVEYIDKKQAIDRIASCYCMDCEHSNGILCRACEHQDDMDLIDDMPSADVQPVKHGRWIKCDYKRLDDAGEIQTYIGQGVYCSKCRTGFHKNEVKSWIGCPCCLARMDGEK